MKQDKKNILSAGCQAISQWLLVRLMSSISWWPGFLAGGLYWQKHSFLCCSGNTLYSVLWVACSTYDSSSAFLAPKGSPGASSAPGWLTSGLLVKISSDNSW